MTKTSTPLYTLLALSGLLITTDADAALVDYNPKYPVPELNASQGAGQIHSMLAAGIMGAKGFGNVVINGNDEAALLKRCQDNTADTTTWPNGCDLGGFATGMTAHWPGQYWLAVKKDGTDAGQTLAVNTQVTGLSVYGSPSVVPLYGQVDHWAAMFRMRADKAVNPWIVSKVWFYDASDPLFVEDIEGNMYEDGAKSYSGATYKTTYYKIFSPASISPADVFWGKYIFAYEPPINAPAYAPHKDLQYAAGTPMLGEGETLTAALAAELALPALELEDMLDLPENRSIAAEGVPGRAFEVHGRTPAGDPWHYFIVPIHDGEMRSVLGIVGLAADDGAFEQLRSFSKPRAVAFRDARQALVAARLALRPGETLGAGALTWDPRCGADHCRTPELPYYEYAIRGADGRTTNARAIVPIQGGAALRR